MISKTYNLYKCDYYAICFYLIIEKIKFKTYVHNIVHMPKLKYEFELFLPPSHADLFEIDLTTVALVDIKLKYSTMSDIVYITHRQGDGGWINYEYDISNHCGASRYLYCGEYDNFKQDIYFTEDGTIQITNTFRILGLDK